MMWSSCLRCFRRRPLVARLVFKRLDGEIRSAAASGRLRLMSRTIDLGRPHSLRLFLVLRDERTEAFKPRVYLRTLNATKVGVVRRPSQLHHALIRHLNQELPRLLHHIYHITHSPS